MTAYSGVNPRERVNALVNTIPLIRWIRGKHYGVQKWVGIVPLQPLLGSKEEAQSDSQILYSMSVPDQNAFHNNWKQQEQIDIECHDVWKSKHDRVSPIDFAMWLCEDNHPEHRKLGELILICSPNRKRNTCKQSVSIILIGLMTYDAK
jgi:hypothetical protein